MDVKGWWLLGVDMKRLVSTVFNFLLYMSALIKQHNVFLPIIYFVSTVG